LIVLSILTFATACSDTSKENLYLKRIDSDKDLRIDTIEQYTNNGLQIVDLTREGALGHSTYHIGIIKKKEGKAIIYQMQNSKSEWPRVTRDYIAFIKPYAIVNAGWFKMKNGNISREFPEIKRIVDSLKKRGPKENFITHANGYISIYRNGRLINELNFGNFLPGLRIQNFDSLNYGLYQYENGKLIAVSKNGNDLKSRRNGIYFVPNPGYEVIRKYDKSAVLNATDSASSSREVAARIIVKPIN